MSHDIKRILESRVGCIVMAICCLVLGIYALCFNAYNRADGNADSISEWLSYVTQEDVITLIVCIIFFVVFLLASKNADKRHLKDLEELLWSEDYEEEIDNSLAQTTAGTYVLEQGKFSIQFMVPYNYTWDKKEKPDIDEDLGMVMFPRFTGEDGRIMDCQLHIEPTEDVENGDNIDALEDVQDQFGYLSEKEQKNVKIKQVVVDGKYIVHYFVEKKKSGFDKLQRLYAACDLDRGKYFVLEMWCMSWKPELDVEDFSEFFHFEGGTV